MNIIKIGNFISELRKSKNLTQAQLAEKLFVEPKTISKWERGNGLPDVSIMSSLCKELDISLNELFIGEHINNKDSNKLIEEAILDTIEKENRINKRNFISETILGIILIIVCLSLYLIAGFVEMKTIYRILIISISTISMILGIFGLCILDVNIGYFECDNCHERFAPTLEEYIFSIHSYKKRKLKCPKCHQTTWATRRLTK